MSCTTYSWRHHINTVFCPTGVGVHSDHTRSWYGANSELMLYKCILLNALDGSNAVLGHFWPFRSPDRVQKQILIIPKYIVHDIIPKT